MNHNPKTKTPNPRSTLLDRSGPARRLKLPIQKSDTNLAPKRRSNSLTSNNSSISDQTVITRQTIRSDIHKVVKEPVSKDFVYDGTDNTFLSVGKAKSETPVVNDKSFRKPGINVDKGKKEGKQELEIISEVG